MTDREKLIQIIDSSRTYVADKENLAEHLLANGVTVQNWIPVSERLPENDTAVIVATDNGVVFQCLYAYDGWDLWDGYTVNITHWMPLPNPPKEDN